MKYRIGTRGSRLSVAQTDGVAKMLHDADPECSFDIEKIVTKGDTDTRPLFAIDQRGIFEKEVDRAVDNGTVDFAVHSMKDVPSSLPQGLVLACVPKREAANDVLVSADGAQLDRISEGGVVGTSSLRRAVQISRKRPDLNVKPVRGNIETRISKIGDGYDAVVLAQAGISRLKVGARYSALPVDEFLPSPGQGALAIVARGGDSGTISMLRAIEDTRSRAESEAERALSLSVESGCRFPVGALAIASGSTLSISAVAFSVDGTESVSAKKEGPASDAARLGAEAGRELVRMGADRLALNWREKLEEWNKNG